MRTIPINDTAVIIYHALLGNLHYAEKDILDFFALVEQGGSLEELKLRFPQIDLEQEIENLYRLGFLVKDDEEQRVSNRIRQREAMCLRGGLIRALRLNISIDCNLACTYCCAVKSLQPRSTTNMSIGTACEAIKLYTGLLLEHRRKVMWVRYFGGEPLLNWSVLWGSLNYAAELASQHDLQLKILLNTNATLLTPSHVRDLSRHRSHLHVIVSLDGPAPAHDAARRFCNGQGSFDLVCRGLRLLQQEDIPISISATLGAHNYKYLRELVDEVLARNIHSLGIDPVRIVSDGSDPESLANALIDAIEYAITRNLRIHGLWQGVCERLKGKDTGTFCGGCGGELSVMPDGEIYPCQALPLRLGTLADVETRVLFTTDVYRQVAMRVAGNLPECQGCEIEGMCAGGCAADAYAYTGNLYGRTRYCSFLRAIVGHYLTRLGQAAKRPTPMGA